MSENKVSNTLLYNEITLNTLKVYTFLLAEE